MNKYKFENHALDDDKMAIYVLMTENDFGNEWYREILGISHSLDTIEKLIDDYKSQNEFNETTSIVVNRIAQMREELYQSDFQLGEPIQGECYVVFRGPALEMTKEILGYFKDKQHSIYYSEIAASFLGTEDIIIMKAPIGSLIDLSKTETASAEDGFVFEQNQCCSNENKLEGLLDNCLNGLKQCNISNFSLGEKEGDKYIGSGPGMRYAGYLHQLTEPNGEVFLVRNENSDNPNTIFLEMYPHKYMGTLSDYVDRFLGPLLNSKKYGYKAWFNNETSKFSLEVGKIGEEGSNWRMLDAGTPQLTDEEFHEIERSFNEWLNKLTSKYNGKKVPSSVNTLIKNGEEKPAIVKEWAIILFRENIETVLIKKGLLNIGAETTKDTVSWDRGDESYEDYTKRVWGAMTERAENITDLNYEGTIFALCTGTLWRGTMDSTFNPANPSNPIQMAIEKEGGIVKKATGKTNYVIIETESGKAHSIGECSKVLKAIDKGNDIKIVTLSNLKELLELPSDLRAYGY